jgi:hypothetical protein
LPENLLQSDTAAKLLKLGWTVYPINEEQRTLSTLPVRIDSVYFKGEESRGADALDNGFP